MTPSTKKITAPKSAPPPQRASERDKSKSPSPPENRSTTPAASSTQAIAPSENSPSNDTSHEEKAKTIDLIESGAPYDSAYKQKDNYPNSFCDPDPLPENASDAQRAERKSTVEDMAIRTLETFNELGLVGHELWVEFISVFRPHTIKMWDHLILIRWTKFLRRNDVYVESDRDSDRPQKRIDLLFRRDHIGLGKSNAQPPTVLNLTLDNKHAEKVGIPITAETPKHTSNAKLITHPDRLVNVQHAEAGPSTTGQHEAEPPPPSRHHGAPSLRTSRGDDPPDDGDDDDDGNDDKPRQGLFGHKKGLNPKRLDPEARLDATENSFNDNPTYGQKGIGINGLMKAFYGKPTFSGSWEEDLENVINVYNTLASMCEVTPDEKLKAIPVMLKGDALSYFANRSKPYESFEDAMNVLRTWYNGNDRKARILSKWQEMRLSDAMEKDPDESEVTIFRNFVSTLMALQHQLDTSYHGDQFLRDRLLTAIDIPHIQASLRDRLPRTSQHAINRVVIQLSDERKSAGTAAACISRERNDYDALYSLGRSYGGDAKRAVKRPYKLGSGSRGRNTRHTGTHQRDNGSRRLKSSWMQGVKGCFVCGLDHRANTRHSPEEVTAAIQKLKAKHPSALLTVEDLDSIVNMSIDEKTEESDDEGSDEILWNEDEDNDDGSDLAYIAINDLKSVERCLAKNAFIHGLSNEDDDLTSAYITTRTPYDNYTHTPFRGVTIDTAVNRRSIMGREQYLAYQQEFGRLVQMRPPKKNVKGIGGKSCSIGEATIQIPFNKLGIVIDVEFLILAEDTPSILSNRDMIDNGLYISLQGGYLNLDGRKQPLTFQNYFYIQPWSANNTPFVLYTDDELIKIHRTFGHPSVSSTYKLLKRASKAPLKGSIRRKLEKIAHDCEVCERNAAAPRRFKLTTGTDDLTFNSRIVVDTMFIEGRPVIQIVDEATHFAAAAFLKSQTTREIWKSILNLWCLTYLGPPDFLAIDQGSSYTSLEFKSKASSHGIIMEEAPIETPDSIRIVERYHAPLRKAYFKIRQSIDRKEMTDEECLKSVVYAVNTTMVPEGLVPMLLVFGAFPRPARTTPAPCQLKRQEAIVEARKLATHEQSKRRIAFALRHPSGPKGKEASARLRQLPPGSDVLVYRTKPKRWDGPYKFISIEGETVVVQLGRGRKIFRSVCVKPFSTAPIRHDNFNEPNCEPHHVEHQPHHDTRIDDEETAYMANDDTKGDLGDEPRKVHVKPGTKEEQMFVKPRQEELEGLLKNGTFKPIHTSNVPKSSRIFNARFIDEIKKAGEGLRKKSRFVAQNYADEDASYIPTKAPTVQRYSQRTALSIAASDPDLDPFLRDIIQAYIQSLSNLERRIFIRAPKEMDLPEVYVLEVVKPLYGIPESGLHWYLSYMTHHLESLNMVKSKVDPCVLIRRDKEKLRGLILLQVDDSLGFGDSKFLDKEEAASSKFKSKPRTLLSKKASTFNGVTIRKLGPEPTAQKIMMPHPPAPNRPNKMNVTTPCTITDSKKPARHKPSKNDLGIQKTISKDVVYRVTQEDKVKKLQHTDTPEGFASNRALAQYIGVNVRPDICAPVQMIAPENGPTPQEDIKQLQKVTTFLKDTADQGLDFVRLSIDTSRIVLVTDASFANTKELKSQLGYLILMTNDKGKCNILHYGSNKCQRIARSVMAAELFALVHGFDNAYIIRELVEEMTGRKMSLAAYIDSKTVFDVIAKYSRTSEKRLQIDVFALRESYDNGELSTIGWMPGQLNAADPLTKCKLSLLSPLYQIMLTNQFSAELLG